MTELPGMELDLTRRVKWLQFLRGVSSRDSSRRINEFKQILTEVIRNVFDKRNYFLNKEYKRSQFLYRKLC